MNQHVQMSEWAEVPVRFTADEFMEFAEGPPFSNWIGKIELVDGVIVRMSPAHIPHWNAQRLLFADIAAIFAAKGHRWIAGQQPTVRLSDATVREPDIAVLHVDTLVGDIFARDALFLAIEISDSSLSIDLNEKRRDYASADVPHYWVVDINARQLHTMMTPRDGDYLDRRVIPFGEPVAVPGTDASITLY